MYQPLTKEQYGNAIKAGFTSQQIIDMEKKRKSLAEQQPGYFQAVGNEYKKAASDITSGIQEAAQQVQKGGVLNTIGGLARGALRTVGGVAEATFAPITEVPIVKQGLETIGMGISKIPGIDVIAKKANELATQYPEYAKDFKNIIDITTLGGGKVAEKPVGKALEKTGVVIEKSGLEAANLAKNKFAQKLVMPVETAKTKLAQVPRTTESESFFKKDIVQSTAQEQAMAQEVSQIPGISEKNTFQKNFNIIRDFNVQQAKQLEADVAQYDFIIPKKEVLSRLNTAAEELKNNPMIVGDAEKTAQKLLEGAKKIIDENEGKGSGLLKARKEYDIWVKNQKPKVFDATSENAFTTANNTVRDTLNDILDEKATNLGIKDSLKKQSTLYRAMDNVAVKAAEEANSPILRTFQKMAKAVGIKNKLVQQVAAIVGIGGLGAAATFAPPVAILGGVGFVTYKAGKLVMDPQVIIGLGKLLQISGKFLNPSDKKILENALIDFKSE